MSEPARRPREAAVAVRSLVAVEVAVRSLVAVEVAGLLVEAVAEARRNRAVAVADLAPMGRCSSWSAHSGTLPCLRRGSSSRLVANIRRPATSFWRVSAGSITSSMYPRSAAAYGDAYLSV